MLNLTPHDIVLRLADGSEVVFKPHGTLARVSVVVTRTGEYVAGVPVVRNVYGKPEGLVYDHTGSIAACIVSGMVLAALPPGTPNVYAPATGATAIRNEKGQVIAVTELAAS